MTSIAQDFLAKWSYDQQGHLAYMPGDLAKGSLVHIDLCDPMTSIL